MKTKLLIIFSLSIQLCFGQIPSLVIDDTKSVQDLVKLLERNGDEISNVTFDIPQNIVGDNPVGQYNDQLGFFGLSTGLIMTNGAAQGALGPNNNSNEWQANWERGGDEVSDPDLLSFLQTMSAQNTTTISVSPEPSSVYDYAIIEFDIKTVHSNISFDYVWGSEEYPFPNLFSKSDGFACFVSGPGVPNQNIATLDNGDVISIVTVNAGRNSDVYNSNGTGETAFINFYHQYDGYTDKLTARTAVTPCETYHVKFIILDEGWDECDSGAFIESSPLEESEKPSITVTYQNPSIPNLVEGCNDATVEIDIPSSLVLANYSLEISGSATSGVDYSTSSIPISFLSSTTIFDIEAFTDAFENENEEVILTLKSKCIVSTLDLDTLEIKDAIEFELLDTTKCKEDSLCLYPDFDPNIDSLRWQNNSTLSCLVCQNPKAFSTKDEEYIFTYIDKISGCEVDDTMNVRISEPEAFFVYTTNQDYTSLDAFFENQSKDAVGYNWSFGDGNSSTDFEPIHTYPITNNQEPETYTVKLIATDVLGCEDEHEETIVISEPLFIPNVYSPNGDKTNDSFWVDGIFLGVWKFEVFNRWGQRVYSDPEYKNDWDGNGLEGGVYFYRLTNPNEDRVFKGWVTILK